MMHSLKFGQPLWFYGMALLPLLAAVFWRCELRRGVLVRKLIAARLLPRLVGSVSRGKRRLRFILLLLAIAAIVTALAQPQWGYTWEERKLHGRDVIVAIDVSRSMLANDISPSRLARAKLAAEDLIGQLTGDRAGLIAFAGTAFLQAPLTADHAAVLDALREIGPEIIPRGGTDIAEAIRTATDAFGKGESDNRALVLFTDGEELEESAVAAAKELNGQVRIFTAGIGSADGSIIAVPSENGQTEYVKDADGQIVKSRLDEPRLREIAQATGGFYVHLVSGPPEMQQIVRDGLKPMTEHDTTSEMTRRPIERYEWPLSAGMILLGASLLVGERKRRVVLAPAGALVLLLALNAPAFGKNPGIEAYEKEDYKGSLDSFQNQLQRRPETDVLQFDLGSAAFKSGDLDRAMQSFSGALTSKDPALRERAEYNLANTLAEHGLSQKSKPDKIKDLKNSLQHYDSALKVQPKDGNAQYNREVVRKLLEELQKEPTKQEEKKEEQKKEEDKKDKQNQKDQSGDKQESQQKKDEQKGQQPKDQQSPQQGGRQQGDKGDSKPESSGEQQPPDRPGDSQENKEEGKGNKSEDRKQAGSPNSPEKPAEPKDQNGQQQPKDQQDEQANQPPSSPGKQEKPKGEPRQAEAKQTPEEQAAEEAAAAAQARMTEGQARQLLDSLKDEDSRVRLLNPGSRKSSTRVIRDW